MKNIVTISLFLFSIFNNALAQNNDYFFESKVFFPPLSVYKTNGNSSYFPYASLNSSFAFAQKSNVQTKSFNNNVICGGTGQTNALICNDFSNNFKTEFFPIPGDVSSTPIYHENAWYIGTSEGILLKIAKSTLHMMPVIKNSILYKLWSVEAKQIIKWFRDKKIDNDENQNLLNNNIDFAWTFFSGFEFIGTPIIVNDVILMQTINQILYAIDINSGKARWATRIAPDTALRLGISPIFISREKKEVVLARNDGTLAGINLENGKIIWNLDLPYKEGEPFKGINSKPLQIERSLIVSDVSGSTLKISLDECLNNSCKINWKQNIASLADIIGYDNNIFIGDKDGYLYVLNYTDGTLLSKSKIFDTSIASLSIVEKESKNKEKSYDILLINYTGEMALVSKEGKIKQYNSLSLGTPLGNFIDGTALNEKCISFLVPGFRCFSVF